MKPPSRATEETFGISAAQRSALVGVVVVLATTFLFRVATDFSAHDPKVEGFALSVGGSNRTYAPLFRVDLNHSPTDSLELLPGIGSVLAARIVAYRDSVGPFAAPRDIMLVAGVSGRIYGIVKDYISVGGAVRVETPPLRIDLNNSPADSLELLSGIGPVLAARIVAYRDSAGPFVTPRDILRVKGVSRRVYGQVKDYIFVAP